MKKDKTTATEVNQKMDLAQYEEKYVSRANYKSVSALIVLVVVAIGVIVVSCLLDIVSKAYAVNEYFGYGTAVIALVVFVLCYILPLCKVAKQKSFRVDVNKYSAKEAKRYNRQLRKQLAEKFIDYTKNVQNGSWYTADNIEALEVCLASKDQELLKNTLSRIYATDVKRAQQSIISKSALQSGLFSAASQSGTLDAVMITVVNLQMIKDIVFLYGFRPTYPRLLKIYRNVMLSAVASYSMNGMGNVIGGAVGGLIKGVPLLGQMVSSIVDSSVQGLTNAGITALIGSGVARVLIKEYRLQDIFDGIDLEDSKEDIKAICDDVSKELKVFGKKKTDA